jgi:ParB family chromosome partitioning protein
VELSGGLPGVLAAELKHMPPTLILHGDRDLVVPVRHAYALREALASRQLPFELKVYRGVGHGFQTSRDGISWLDALDAEARAVRFLKQYLTAGKGLALTAGNVRAVPGGTASSFPHTPGDRCMDTASRPDVPIPQAIPLPPPGEAEERDIPVADIDPEPDQPRKSFDEERDRELEASIRELGQINAIIVYLHLVTRRYRLIAGERRWRAFQRLDRKTIRARVLSEPPDEARRRELMLIDNEQRQDLSDIERGMAYLDFTTRTGCTASALAQKVGKHVSTVTRAINLIKKLPEDLRQAIGPELPASVAQLLTSLPDDDAKRHFAGLYRTGNFKSGDELAATLRAARKGQAPASTVGFTADEGGVRIAVTWTTGNHGASPEPALTAVENALRIVLKDLREQGQRGLEFFKDFLSKKAKTARKSAELQAAQTDLARHASGSGNGGN